MQVQVNYGYKFTRPYLAVNYIVVEPTLLEKLRGGLSRFMYTIEPAIYFALSVAFFKYALIGHF